VVGGQQQTTPTRTSTKPATSTKPTTDATSGQTEPKSKKKKKTGEQLLKKAEKRLAKERRKREVLAQARQAEPIRPEVPQRVRWTASKQKFVTGSESHRAHLKIQELERQARRGGTGKTNGSDAWDDDDWVPQPWGARAGRRDDRRQ